MRKLQRIFVLLCLMGSLTLHAQQRYLDEVFTSVVRMDSVVYGNNISVLLQAQQDLIMDIYMPAGDTVTDRPVVIMFATGNFLPAILNGAPTGTIKDSVIVEICTRLAKRGYVVAATFNRQGWDALNPSQEIQTATLLQAAYRGIIDARTAIRFMRKTVAEDGNPYGINPDKIVVGGEGTGGYISLGAAFFDDYTKVLLPKFTDFNTGNPYIDTTVHGNIFGTNLTSQNIPNHVGYSSEFNMAFNIGGALGDSSWMDPGDMPVVSFHTPQDPNAPYQIGIVIVPTTGNTVIDEAAGSYTVTQIANAFGNNDVFVNAGFSDPFTTAANTLNDGNEGLFPFDRPFTPGDYTCTNGATLPLVPEGSPWSWWNEAAFVATWDFATGGTPFPGVIANCRQRASNPDMSATKARTYMDSIVGYLVPRMNVALELNTTSIQDRLLAQQLEVYPNPTQGTFTVAHRLATQPLRQVEVLDITGRRVLRADGLNAQTYTATLPPLPAGLYLVRVQTDKAQATLRLQVN